MKILFFIESLRSGGKERRFLELIKGLAQISDFEFRIIILSNRIDYSIPDFIENKIIQLKRNLKKDIFLISKFIRIVDNFKPDIIHGWDDVGAIHFGPYCRLKNIPFVNSGISTAPNNLPVFSRKFLSVIVSYPFSSVILTNSFSALKCYKVPIKKGRYIHNGFDNNRISSIKSLDVIKKEIGINTNKIVGMTAAFAPRKDYNTFVLAAEILLKKRRDITFLAIGDGPDFEKIKNSISDGFRSNFKFLGKCEDVESYVNIFDIGVLCAFSEGISNAIMEYMALSKPVIATDCGGTSELILNNITGFLIEPKNAEQLAEKIELLLSDESLALSMGNQGKERINNHFSLDKMVTNTYQLYKEIIKK